MEFLKKMYGKLVRAIKAQFSDESTKAIATALKKACPKSVHTFHNIDDILASVGKVASVKKAIAKSGLKDKQVTFGILGLLVEKGYLYETDYFRILSWQAGDKSEPKAKKGNDWGVV